MLASDGATGHWRLLSTKNHTISYFLMSLRLSNSMFHENHSTIINLAFSIDPEIWISQLNDKIYYFITI